MKKSRFVAIIALGGLLSVTLSSCGSSSSGGGGGQPTPNVQGKNLQIGNMGLVPTNPNALGATYPLMVFNNTGEVMMVDSVTASGVAQAIKDKIGSDTSQLFDSSMCQQIQPHGSCSIQIKSAALVDDKGIGSNGQYGINISAHLKSSNKSYQEDQVIGYQHFNTSPANGVYYNTSNATVTNIVNNDNMGITIPVYFDRAYSNVKINSGALGGNLVGCGTPNQNGLYNIPAKSSCALTTVFQGGKQFTSLITLDANYTQSSKQAKLANNSLKSGSGSQIMSVSVVNNISPQALMTTAAVTGFVPADNNTSVTVTFVNAGSYQAQVTAMGFVPNNGVFTPYTQGSPISIGSGATATVTGDTCNSQTIQAGNSCQVMFKVNSQVNSGSLNIQMNYATGLGSGSGSTFYNVYYYAPTSNVVLTSTVSGDLTNTFLYQTSTATVTVNNTSTTNTAVTLDNGGVPQLLAVGNPSKPNSITVTTNSCNQNGGVLNAGLSCAYIVTYNSPTESTNGIINNLRGVVTGTYSNIGNTITVGTTASLPYSANANSTFISVNPDPLQMVVPAGQSISQKVTVTNQTSGSIINNILFNLSGVNGASLPSGSNTCTSASLSYLQSCQVTFLFAPSAQESVVTNIPITFNMNGNPAQDVLAANFQGSTSAVNVVLSSINASQPGLPGGAPLYSGDGESQNSAFSFYNYGNSLQIALTYQNLGTESAVNIQMMGDTFPTAAAGYSIQDNCSGQTLLQNQTCTVVATTINPVLSTSLTGSLNLSFAIPSMVYTDAAENVFYVKNMFTTPAGNSSNIWVNVNPSVVANVTAGTGSIVELNGGSYYLYPVIFTNNANVAQAVAINYTAPMPTQASPYGFGDTMTAVPATSATSVSLAGGQAVTKYLWFPVTATPAGTSIAYSVSYNGTYPYFGYTNVSANPMIGVGYTASGNTITASWNTLQSFSGSFINVTGATAGSGSISQLLQNQGYLYAVNGNVYSMPITPWNTSGSTYYPESTSTGSLGSVTAQTTGYTAGYLAVNTTGSTTYAAVAQSGSTNLYAYGVSGGVFTSLGSATALAGLSSNVGSVAIGNTGNLYVTSESNLYLCGTITAIATCNKVTSLPAFPSATTAVNGLTVAVTANGYVFVTPNVAAGTSGTIPVTSVYYALDTGSTTTSFTAASGGNTNYSGAQTVAFNYNLVYGSLNQLTGYYGLQTYYSNPSYSTNPQLQVWNTMSLNSSSITSYLNNTNPFAFYSFMPVESNGISYY